jgi:tRNA (cmo5U34)-methyltransferase
MSSEVEAVFTRTAATYDEARAKLIPCYSDFYGTAVKLLPFSTAEPVHILDLGAGTGILSAWIRQRFPVAELRLVDFSEAMLSQARERLGGEHVEFELSDFTRDPLHGPCDAIVSALAIHHLPDEAKRKLFFSVFSALRPGGVFVNAEQVAGPTPELTARYHALWLEESRACGASEQMIAEAEMRMRQDRCASVEDYLWWMRGAGFRNADCWFKHGQFAVMAGTREEKEA